MSALLSVSGIVFPLITFPYVARVLSTDSLGKVNFAVSVIAYFMMFAQLGIPTYGIRACARVRDNKEKLSKTVQELFIINMITDAVVYIALAVCINIIPKLVENKELVLIVSITIFLNSIGMEWLYEALEEYVYITIRSIAFKTIALIAMFFIITSEDDFILYGIYSIFASSASNIINFIHARKYINVKPVGGYNLKRHLKSVIVFFAMSCATTIYTNLDTIMLGFMKTDEEVAFYNSAVKIKILLVAVVTSLGTVLLPRLSYYIEHDMIEDFRKTCKKALNFVFLLALPLTVYFIYFAKNGILLFAGDKYYNSILPMQIIMPTVIFIGITNILGIQILIPLGKEKIVLYSEIAGAIVDFGLNLLFIPRFGAAGAALGTLAAEIVVLIIQLLYLKDSIADAFKEVQYIKIFIAIVAGAFASFWVVLLELSNFFTVLVSAALFFSAYLTVLILTKEKLSIELTEQLINRLKKTTSDDSNL